MSGHDKPFSIWAACMVVGVAAAFIAAGASEASSSKIQCEIATTESGNFTAIESLVHATEMANGSYTLTVSGTGTNIRQGGAFSANAHETVKLGTVNLGSTSKGYDLRLDITANGKTTQCAEWIGRI